jgi:hemolysin-activating ACP:hemolysin acyltransferase
VLGRQKKSSLVSMANNQRTTPQQQEEKSPPKISGCIFVWGCGLSTSMDLNFLMALQMWVTVAPYSGYRSETIAWRLFPAVKHGRIRHFWDGERYMGFVTWAWLTREEMRTHVYNGPEVFARESGEVLYIMDMIAPGGRSDVYYMAKTIRLHLSGLYPETQLGYSRRHSRRLGSYARRG